MRLIDLTGKKFGKLTVIERVGSDKQGYATWLCKCDCGTKIIIRGSSLKGGYTKSCGCIHLIDLTGQKFGRLTVIRRSYPNGNSGEPRWLCKCECGKETVVKGACLRKGEIRSCGCLRKELARNRRILPLGLASMKSVIDSYKRNAKIRGIEWNLIEEQFAEITKKDCYYCGAKPNNKRYQPRNNGEYIYNGIDRKDNTKGYTIDNVVPCCSICNMAKSNLTEQEFKDWIKRLITKNIKILGKVFSRKKEFVCPDIPK